MILGHVTEKEEEIQQINGEEEKDSESMNRDRTLTKDNNAGCD